MVPIFRLAAAIAYAILGWVSRQSAPVSVVLFYSCLGIASAAYIGVFLLLRRRGVSRTDLCWILAGAIAFRIIGFFGQPIYEDDFNRYLWDGRAFALTGNPYQHP